MSTLKHSPTEPSADQQETHRWGLNPARRSMLLVLLAFAAPVIVAKLFLVFDYQSEVKTHGTELLEVRPVYSAENIENPVRGLWQLAYVLPLDCLQACQQSLYIMQQNHLALGREQERVKLVLWGQVDSATALKLKPDAWTEVALSHRQSSLAEGYSYVIDPQGNAVLRLKFGVDQADNIQRGRNLLLDLKQLLKLSHIG